MGVKGCGSENKNSCEISGQIITIWEHAQLQI